MPPVQLLDQVGRFSQLLLRRTLSAPKFEGLLTGLLFEEHAICLAVAGQGLKGCRKAMNHRGFVGDSVHFMADAVIIRAEGQ